MTPVTTLLHSIPVSCILLALSLVVQPGSAAERPNVLLIISDDQGYSDFGFNGNKHLKTPNIDRLAAQSAVFDNFVVNPACSPSRSSFYTGRQNLNTGVWGVGPRANFKTDEVMMPAFFREAGYHTFYAGKSDTVMHLPYSTPWERGWDQGFFGSGGYIHLNPNVPHRGGMLKAKGWTVDVHTDLIIDFWKKKPNKPWLATAAYIVPHLPWECPKEYSAPYEKMGFSKDLALCYGSITQMDTAIGRLLNALRESGQEKNTIVLFVSDNGMSEKDNSMKPLPAAEWAKRNIHQLRGNKSTVWENGIRVPCLVSWPEHIMPGTRAQLGGAEDLLPTLLDLAGIAPDSLPHLPFDGVSLRPVLEDTAKTIERPALFRLAVSGPGSPKDLPVGKARLYEDHHLALRGQRYKYHALLGGQSELYDLISDPSEKTDVKSQFPEISNQMAKECHERWERLIASGRSFQSLAVEKPKAK
jgi:arylsulfatase A-like enzyme